MSDSAPLIPANDEHECPQSPVVWQTPIQHRFNRHDVRNARWPYSGKTRWLAVFASHWIWSGCVLALIGIFLFIMDLAPSPFTATPSVESCNPFEEFGYLHTNRTDPGDNTWRPYRKDCPPVALYGGLIRYLKNLNSTDRKTGVDELPWMRNRTIVTIGDSVDRFLVSDFCSPLQSRELTAEEQEQPVDPSITTGTPRFYVITDNSKLSPPPFYYDGENETTPPDDWPSDRASDFARLAPALQTANRGDTGPKVCYLPSHNFMIVQFSSWGLSPSKGGYHFHGGGGFHPPHKLMDRVEHIVKPALKRLADHFHRPQMIAPDIIQLCSGFWDLWDWSAEDFAAANEVPSEESDTVFAELSPTRLDVWRSKLVETLISFAKAFPDRSTTLMWRTYSRPQGRHWHIPYSRLNQLESLVEDTLQKLMKENEILRPRLRINRWGQLFRGNEWQLPDGLHPGPLPGGILWADIILWELKRMAQLRGSR